MNQIINMIIRQVMRKFVSKGIDAGFNKASTMRGGGNRPPRDAIDEHGNPAPQTTNRDEVRAARRAKRQAGGSGAKQTKQAMKMIRRAGKL